MPLPTFALRVVLFTNHADVLLCAFYRKRRNACHSPSQRLQWRQIPCWRTANEKEGTHAASN